MDIEVLRSFTEIIESGSITAAAKKLYVTQAALSTQLKTLEKELDTVLLIRSAHRLELTEAGKILYKRAKSIIAAEGSLKKEIHDRENGIGGSLRIGISSEEGFGICGDILTEFLRKYPDTRCEIYEAPDFELLAMADNGALGAVFIRTPCTVSADMQLIHFSPECMTAVYDPARFDIYGNGTISLKQLSGKKIAVQRRYERLIKYTLSRKPKKEQLPEMIFTADSISSVISAALQGIAIGIMPFSAAAGQEKLLCRNIEDSSLFTERIIAAKNSGMLSAAERRFMEYALPEARG